MSDITLPAGEAPVTSASAPSAEDLAAQLRIFLESRFGDVNLDETDDIFALGFVNSLFALELVLFLEKATGCRIPNEELVLDHFRSLESMVDLAGRITAPAGAQP
jgi:methoxymalonate biosynthesis acyl carrier protein